MRLRSNTTTGNPPGSLTARSASFHLAGILPMTGIAIDRDLTPEYPGITEAATIGDWDPPFPVDLKRVRPRDEDYWKKYRTAPKAFIALETGQKLWGSRFGKATSIRIDRDVGRRGVFAAKLRALIDPAQLGMAVYAPRAQALESAQRVHRFRSIFHVFQLLSGGLRAIAGGVVFSAGNRAATARDRHSARRRIFARLASGTCLSPKDLCCRSPARFVGTVGAPSGTRPF